MHLHKLLGHSFLPIILVLQKDLRIGIQQMALLDKTLVKNVVLEMSKYQ